jgi:hypothetical protein
VTELVPIGGAVIQVTEPSAGACGVTALLAKAGEKSKSVRQVEAAVVVEVLMSETKEIRRIASYI